MNELVLLESSTLRQELCTEENTQLLDKVGELVLLPQLGYALLENVAEFFEAPEQTLRKAISRHKTELVVDGYKVFTRSKFCKLYNVTLHSKARYIAVFPRRAVLRMAMLLRDSPVARQIRSYLLDVEEKLSAPNPNPFTLNKMAYKVTTQDNALQQHKNELTLHADQLTKHARRLAENADQLLSQSRMMKAVVGEIYKNRDSIQQLQSDAQIYQQSLHEYQKKLEIIEEKLNLPKKQKEIKAPEYIDKKQIALLKKRVKETGNPGTVWAQLKKHFSITRYIFLRKDQFDKALEWLEQYKPA